MLLPLLLTMAAPAAQAAPSANQSDLRCMAALSAISAKVPEAQRGQVISGVMFFYGRIIGRSPSFNIETAMIQLMKSDPQGKTLGPDVKRCGTEMNTRGTYLVEMGKHITAAMQAK